MLHLQARLYISGRTYACMHDQMAMHAIRHNKSGLLTLSRAHVSPCCCFEKTKTIIYNILPVCLHGHALLQQWLHMCVHVSVSTGTYICKPVYVSFLCVYVDSVHERIHAYIYKYIHASIRTQIHTCIHTYMHIHARTYIVCACMWILCMNAYMHTYTNTYMHPYIHKYIHAFIHTCTYMHVHTYIHAPIHPYIHADTSIHASIHACIHTYRYLEAQL